MMNETHNFDLCDVIDESKQLERFIYKFILIDDPVVRIICETRKYPELYSQTNIWLFCIKDFLRLV